MFCATQAHHVYSELDKNLHTVLDRSARTSRGRRGGATSTHFLSRDRQPAEIRKRKQPYTLMSEQPGCVGGVRVCYDSVVGLRKVIWVQKV